MSVKPPIALENPVCDRIARQGIAGCYLAGTLTPEAAASFEDHFLTCARCQDALTAQRHARRPPRVALAGAGLAAAAVIALLIVLPRGEPAALAIDAPVYLGIDVRAAPDRGTELFDRAMARYNAEEYVAAAKGLQEALDAGAPVAPAAFFQAAALLLSDQPRAAVRAFTRVIAVGQTPYLDEARFYRAHAHNRLRDVDAAHRDLGAIAPDHPLKAEAVELSKKLGQ